MAAVSALILFTFTRDLNYINHHTHTEYLKMIEFYSPCGIWHVFLCFD